MRLVGNYVLPLSVVILLICLVKTIILARLLYNMFNKSKHLSIDSFPSYLTSILRHKVTLPYSDGNNPNIHKSQRLLLPGH